MAGRIENLVPFKPGYDPRRGSKPKGTKDIATDIKNLSYDENFTVDNIFFEGKPYKGTRVKALIMTAYMQALQGDHQWAEWIAKHGWPQTTKQEGNTLNVIFTNGLPRPTDSISTGLPAESEAGEVPFE